MAVLTIVFGILTVALSILYYIAKGNAEERVVTWLGFFALVFALTFSISLLILTALQRGMDTTQTSTR